MNTRQTEGASPPAADELYVSPSFAIHRDGPLLQLGVESVQIASISSVNLVVRTPPVKGPLLLALFGTLLCAIGASIGAQGVGIAVSGIPCLVIGCHGLTHRRSSTALAITLRNGRTRVLYSRNSEPLELLAWQLRHRTGERQTHGIVPRNKSALGLSR